VEGGDTSESLRSETSRINVEEWRELRITGNAVLSKRHTGRGEIGSGGE